MKNCKKETFFQDCPAKTKIYRDLSSKIGCAFRVVRKSFLSPWFFVLLVFLAKRALLQRVTFSRQILYSMLQLLIPTVNESGGRANKMMLDVPSLNYIKVNNPDVPSLNYGGNGLGAFWDKLLYIIIDIFLVLFSSTVFFQVKFKAVLKRWIKFSEQWLL